MSAPIAEPPKAGRVSIVRRRARAEERGFTLLELLVAAIAGLFVVLAAFLLSRGATRLFADEGRVANTQLNLRLGVDRLRQDLERAAFMGSANVYLDPDVAPKPGVLSLGSMRIQGIYYQPGTTTTSDAPQSALQGLYPDKITITGNLTSTDSYLAADIAPSSSGSGVDIILQKNFGSTARLLGAGETSTVTAALEAVFPPGRMIRVRNLLGSSQFLTVTSISLTADGRPLIVTAGTPKYVTTDMSECGGDRRCGGSGNCIGCEISPLQQVQYSVRSLKTNTNFAWAYVADSGAPGDATKYDLVRQEFNPKDGTAIANTEEIVAEYAVDLAFAFSVDTSAASAVGTAWQEPSISAFDFGAADNAVWGGDGAAGNRPQRIRSVRYRLTTRTRYPESAVGADDGGPGLMRYMVATGKYTRARTVTGEVALVNQGGIRW